MAQNPQRPKVRVDVDGGYPWVWQVLNQVQGRWGVRGEVRMEAEGMVIDDHRGVEVLWVYGWVHRACVRVGS